MVAIEFFHILVFLPLIISLLLFNTSPKYIPLLFVSTSLVSAFLVGVVDLFSACVLMGYGFVCYTFAITTNRLFKSISTILVLLLTIVLMTHMLKGIINPKIINDYYFSEDAVPFSKYLNFDKVIAGVFLLLYVVPKPNKVSYENRILFVLVTTSFISIALFVASLLGKINIEPKFSEIIVPWAITNLFFTCYVEEAFFRGYVQERISLIFIRYKYNHWVAITLSGGLFGLVHLPAGVIYSSIAAIVGCSLAYIYYKTKNIYCPIFAHFTFNLIHCVFFTYPYIR